MATTSELATFGAYLRNFDNSISVLINERIYLERMSQSVLTNPLEALSAAGAAASIASKIVMMTDAHEAYLASLDSLDGRVKPPTPAQIEETTRLATSLAAEIHRSIDSSATVDLVTRFFNGWNTVMSA